MLPPDVLGGDKREVSDHHRDEHEHVASRPARGSSADPSDQRAYAERNEPLVDPQPCRGVVIGLLDHEAIQARGPDFFSPHAQGALPHTGAR
jgi:hypothetical protein